MSCVIGLLLSCYILVELLSSLLSYCLWSFVFSWFKSKRESIDLGILPQLSCQAFFVSALSFPTIYDLQIHQMNMKITFLNVELDEEIYMEQPEGFVVPRK